VKDPSPQESTVGLGSGDSAPGGIPPSLVLAGEPAVLLPDPALFLPSRGTVLVTDLHLGKEASFRSHGLGIPEGDSAADLERLSRLLTACGAVRMIILGDFFHARSGRSEELDTSLLRWRLRHPEVELLLIRGNHDRGAGDPPSALGIDCRTGPVEEAGLVLCHEPGGRDPGPAGGYTLAGHLHPSVVLKGGGRERMRLPCFWFGVREGVLPAFGRFTGTAPVTPRPGDRIFVVGEGVVVEVPLV